ncbi:MAG: hydantoinase B/oxoprolinase family protein [Alphaproteobacteria bacterium]|nr:hydantoinase B/oxoprolinase family protein [Alphaproteobacteria bacterium]
MELNVRVPEKVLGDIRAQIAACNVAERGYLDLYRRYGVAATDSYFEEIHDYAERLARAEIAEIPDGIYRFENHIDGLGPKPREIVIRVAVHVHGDSVTVDWAGTNPQVPAGINSPIPFTKAATYAALRSVMSSEIPNSQGFTRAIEVRAPVGSIVNPEDPGACGARGITGFRMIDCLMGALAQALPTRVPADGNGGATITAIGGRHRGGPFVFVETVMGNTGGMPQHDGQSAVSHVGANQSNIPLEMIEAEHPLRVERYEFVPDSGGPGRWRGGVAMRREIRLLADSAVLTIRSDKRRFRPYGLAGGKPGTASSNQLLQTDGTTRTLPVLLLEPEVMQRGDIFRHELAGGGGMGNPLEREPELVLADVILGLVTPEGAARDYGVVVDAGAPPRLDSAATLALRARRRAADREVQA